MKKLPLPEKCPVCGERKVEANLRNISFLDPHTGKHVGPIAGAREAKYLCGLEMSHISNIPRNDPSSYIQVTEACWTATRQAVDKLLRTTHP
jgi:hypothetical protein